MRDCSSFKLTALFLSAALANTGCGSTCQSTCNRPNQLLSKLESMATYTAATILCVHALGA